MKIQVHNGTARSENLCDSCKHCTHIEGQAVSKEIHICQALYEAPFRLKFTVARCTDYRGRDEKNLAIFKEVAWIVRTSASGVAVGFHSPKNFREQHPEEEVVPYERH